MSLQMLMALFEDGGVPPTVYQFSNLSLTGGAPSGSKAQIDILFDADGGRRKFLSSGGGGGSTSDANPPWSDAHPSESATWHCRLVSHDSGSNRYVGTPTLGTWTEISAAGIPTFDFEWQPGGGPQGPDVSTYTFAISDDAGVSTYDTGTLTCTFNIESP